MAKKVKVKVRRTWGTFKPTTRVKQSKRIYSRKRHRETDYGIIPGFNRAY